LVTRLTLLPVPKSSLRLRLGLLVAGTLLPLILFAVGVVYLNHMRAREQGFDRVMQVVRNMRLVLDTEMQGVTLALDVLAGTQALQRGDFDGFRRNTEAFLKKYPGQAISLASRDGRQLLNTGVPSGTPLPPRQNRDSIDQVFSTGKPAFSNLFIGSVTRSRIVTISVPVFRDGQVIYEMSFNVPLGLFQRIITQQQPSSGWTMSIFDHNGVNFARVPNPEQTIGQSASSTLLPSLMSGDDEGKLYTVSREGTELITAFTRSPLTGWKIAAGTPVAALTAPLWRELAITASIGTILLVIGLFFAVGMATRIARGEMLHDLLINELNHRVKNTLATVQSIASQTLRRSDNAAEAIDKFSARLVSLGRTHNVLSEEKWESAQVRELVDGTLAPYASQDGARIHAAGPDLRLAPRTALTVAMALHELATNAAKYGALSNDRGQVFVDWSTADATGQFRLIWREVGGPPVAAPARSGFGSKLIERGPEQIGGSATLEFRLDGVVCTLLCPLR
jgi:two-component sensor histidine kinase